MSTLGWVCRFARGCIKASALSTIGLILAITPAGASGLAIDSTETVVGTVQLLHADKPEELLTDHHHGSGGEEDPQAPKVMGDADLVAVLKTGNTVYDLDVSDGTVLKTGQRVEVTGDVSQTSSGASIQATSVQALSASVAPTPTMHRVLVLPVYWSGVSPDSLSQANLLSRANVLDGYYDEISNGHVGVTPTVAPWASIARPTTCENYSDLYTMIANAKTKATSNGYNMNSYDHYMLYFPAGNFNCSFGGLGEVSGQNTWIPYFDLRVIIHELGHNIGMWHSNAYDCKSGSTRVAFAASGCTNREYYDPFDFMGHGFNGVGHLSAMQQNRMGWLSSNQKRTVSSGQYIIAPIESTEDELQALTVSTAYGPLWIEFRRAIGVDSWLDDYSGATNGVLIHIDRSSEGYQTKNQLLDMTPSTSGSNYGFNDAALAPGKTFTTPDGLTTIQVDSVSDEGAVVSINPSGTTPDKPTISSVTTGSGSATVTVAPPSDTGGRAISSYKVYASPGTKTGTSTNGIVTVSGLTNGTAYTFSATVTNSANKTSARSNSSSSYTPYGTPSAPTGVVATGGNQSASVAFTAPTTVGGGSITSYTVTSTPGGLTATGAHSPLTVTGLTNGVSYTFKVTATNTGGKTSASSTASSAIIPADAPGTPRNVAVTAGSGSGRISFDAPLANGGAAITSYKVMVVGRTTVYSGTSSPITVTGLTNGTTYRLKVAAYNAGKQLSSYVESANFTPFGKPGTPSSVVATSRDQAASVAFAPSSTTGGGTMSYTVTASPGGFSATGTSSPITVAGLTNGTSYTFTVTARNSFDVVSSISAKSAAMIPAGTPDAPTSVVVTPKSGAANVAITAPANTGGAVITKYKVLVSPGDKVFWGTTSTVAVTGLTNGTTYTFKAAVYNAGKVTGSYASDVTAKPTGLAGTPKSVRAVPASGQATISFSAPDKDGGTPITSYTVKYKSGTEVGYVGGSSSPIVVTGLTNGKTYSFSVGANNANGTSIASTAITSVIAGTPGSPQNVLVSRDRTVARLAWSAPSSNGGATITSYKITYNGHVIWVTSKTAVTITGLTNGGLYTFNVYAYNAAKLLSDPILASPTSSAKVKKATLKATKIKVIRKK